ncbi:B12-binding domain-containing radical SAM protein [bacterium]|nr:B12-binding domain-containing radical SAM protein [bacterium]
MSDILLVALNARYHHTSFALRYLKANLGELEERCQLLELTLEERALDCVEKILQQQPRLIGFSIYIWNTTQSLEIIRMLKKVAPEIPVVVGGPEVSYEWESQEIVAKADYLITHEGEVAFRQLAEDILGGRAPAGKVIAGGQPPIESLRLPYRLYTDHDLQHRVVYVEASRGCPFRCEFCLSSLDKAVRYFPLDELLAELQTLLDRGARQFKFIDRTFNLRLEVSQRLLQFFLDRYTSDLFVHFEMVPDRFPEELRQLVAQFPAGAVQFEIGIQSFDPEVQKAISRRQDMAKLQENLQFLRNQTGVHIHADLIVGLPGESLEQFQRGFDRLVQLNPQEIQVGILKRLRGTPILRHDRDYQMIYADSPPYEVLSTSAMNFQQMMSMKRFARFWEAVANRGRFPRTLPLLLADSPFQNFSEFTQWALPQVRTTREMPHLKLAELLFSYLVDCKQLPLQPTAEAMLADFTEDGKRHPPGFLYARVEIPRELLKPAKNQNDRSLPERQARHLASAKR